MKQVGVVGHVPLGIAEERIKLAKGGIGSFVTPSESSVLKVDLLELTLMKRCSKPIDATAIDISLVFISGTENLVEVPCGKPSDTGRWSLAHQLGEESVFTSTVGRPVDRRNLEEVPGRPQPNHGR
jgi:hypothetical protein